MNSLLLTDSTMPVSFCRAGVGCARAMAEYLGEGIHMVGDVHEELKRLSAGFPALEALLSSWPRNPIRELDLQLKAEVAAALKARQAPGRHPKEDLGETATVFFAARQREQGETFAVVTDDGYGKRLAKDRGLAVVTTAELTIEMVRADALVRSDGARVWRQCVGRARWNEFDATLAQARAKA